LACGLTLTAAVIAAPSAAQAESLAQERQAVFAQMIAAPADRDLMRAYARLSVRMRDYEAAASTLERLLDLEPGNAAARLELAQAYFALGAYDVAEYHLAALAGVGGLDAEAAATAEAYAEEAAARQNANRFGGRIALGAAWSDSGGDAGISGSVNLTWRADLGGANGTTWRTDLGGIASGSGGIGDRSILRLRSGPEFSISGESFGARLQPYLQFSALRDDDGTDLDEIGIGLAYQNPHSAQITSFADVYAGQAENTLTGEEIDVTRYALGAVFRPTGDISLRLTLSRRDEDGTAVDRDLRQARLEAQFDIDAPLAGIRRDWEVGVDAALADLTVTGGGNARQDDLSRFGVSLRAFVTDDAYVQARIDRLDRRSTLAGFDADDTVFSLQLGWEF
jgi:tetratricopeptide (TPR) repeat protein